MTRRTIGAVAVFSLVGLIAVYDIAAIIWDFPTVSQVIWDYSEVSPWVPFALGVAAGHLIPTRSRNLSQ